MLENYLFETHFGIIPFPIYVIDIATYAIMFTNKPFDALFGKPDPEVPCHKALFQRDSPCLHCRIKNLVTPQGVTNGETVVFEFFNEVTDRWYQLQEKVISWPDGRTAKYSIAVDISELKETQNRLAEAHAELALKNKELERLSTRDRLTGIYNRLKLDEILTQELSRSNRYGSPLSVLLLDVDFFKAVNDNLGHQAGDAVLSSLAKLLLENIRKNDAVGRWGGEEFLFICPGVGKAQAMILAEKLRSLVERHAFPHGLAVTVSLGGTAHIKDDTQERIVNRADEALYAAKANGRNRVEWSDAIA